MTTIANEGCKPHSQRSVARVWRAPPLKFPANFGVSLLGSVNSLSTCQRQPPVFFWNSPWPAYNILPNEHQKAIWEPVKC